METTRPDEEPEGSTVQPCVVTRMAGGRYAFAMVEVTEVGRISDVTRLPGVPPFVSGVTNWRGKLLAVLDIRRLLGDAAPEPLGGTARVVVVQHGLVVAGVVTEAVEGVQDIDLGALEDAPPTAGGRAASLISGQALDEQGPISVIDAAQVAALRSELAESRLVGAGL